MRWVKVWILLGFYDIGYDIEILGVQVGEMLDFTGFNGILFEWFDF